MIYVCFDTETHLIRRGMTFPRMVCASFAHRSGSGIGIQSDLVLRDEGLERLRLLVRDPNCMIIAHNAAYDMGILAAEAPDLIPEIFAAYDAGRVRCTVIRQQLLDIATGVFKSAIDENGKKLKYLYNLQALASRLLGKYIPKADTWRLHYAYLDGVPVEEWPLEARTYALEDAITGLEIFEAQEIAALEEGSPDGTIPDELRQARNDFAFRLEAGWGLRTDREPVENMKAALEAEWVAAEKILREEGVLGEIDKKTGKPRKNMKLIASLVEADYASRGEPIPRTKTGRVSTGKEVLQETSHRALLTLADISGDLKLLSTYVPILHKGLEVPCTSSPRVLVDSGRSSWSDPNWQNPPRKGGVRECVIPRPGNVFCFVDFDTIELRGLAQTCLELFGYSEMAECLRRGEDLHVALAADMLSIGYQEAIQRYDEGDPVLDVMRQSAKSANFGFPGGMGVAKFVWAQRELVKKLMKKDPHFEPMRWGAKLRDAWLTKFHEMRAYFAQASRETQHGAPCQMIHPWSGRVRGGLDYCSYANSWFQGRVADGAKYANYNVVRASHVEEGPIRHLRSVLFLHDEIGSEIWEPVAHEAAHAKTKIMIESMTEVIPDIPITAKPVLCRKWYKGAKPVKIDGRLVPSKPVTENGKLIWVADL